jgi:hypothetical protein
VGHGFGNGLLEQLPIADRPGGSAVALPLGRHHQGWPAQLLGRSTNGGISAAGTAMEQQVNKAPAAAGEQLSGHALLRPGQITAASGRDHQRTGWGYFRARREIKIHESAARGDNWSGQHTANKRAAVMARSGDWITAGDGLGAFGVALILTVQVHLRASKTTAGQWIYAKPGHARRDLQLISSPTRFSS